MFLCPSVRVLGDQYFNIYLIGESEKALIECGVSYIIPELRKQLYEVNNTESMKRMVIMHAHFDHVCGLPGLQKIFPAAKVAASEKAADILSREQVVGNFFKEDKEMTAKLGSFSEGDNDNILPSTPMPPRTLPVDLIIGDGELWELSPDFKLHFYHAPGHSPCSLIAYNPENKVLFSSDSAGFPVTDEVTFPIFFQSYKAYIRTIKKMMGLPVRFLATAHGEIITGVQKVKSHLKSSLDGAERVRQYILAKKAEGFSEKEIARHLFEKFFYARLKIYTPENIMMCCRLLVKRSIYK